MIILSDIRPRSAPALELLSRAVSSVGVSTAAAVPTQGAIPGGGGIEKKLPNQIQNFKTSLNKVQNWGPKCREISAIALVFLSKN